MFNYTNQNVTIEDAQIFAKNFSGEKNDDGARSVGVFIDEDLAEELLQDGWPVKYHHDYKGDPDAPDRPCLYAKVKFGKVPPRAILITSKGKIKLNEDTIDQLDWTRYKNIDLKVRPYNYPAMRGREAGISVYLKSIYVTVEEDDLDIKYGDIPFVGNDD